MNAPLPNATIAKLKSLAQRLEPVLVLGKLGVTDGFVRSLDEVLGLQELVKLKFGAFKEERKQLGPQLAARTNSHLVWIVGHVAVFYRQQPDVAKRKVQV